MKTDRMMYDYRESQLPKRKQFKYPRRLYIALIIICILDIIGGLLVALVAPVAGCVIVAIGLIVLLVARKYRPEDKPDNVPPY